MSASNSAIYRGLLVHKRMAPVRHELRYKVFNCLFDCDALDELSSRCRWFSYNRFNLVSLHDRDHVSGTTIAAYVRRVVREAGFSHKVSRVLMLCYPRVLGYVFNPLTVYFCLDQQGKVLLNIYEVRNTFGEQYSYVIVANNDDCGINAQSCRKRFPVSPFNAVEGTYLFRSMKPAEKAVVGVALRVNQAAVMKAHFTGCRSDFTDRNLLKAIASTGWLTVKVISAIHWEALKLWLKGLPFVKRPKTARVGISFSDKSVESDS